jgi:hypothetical protein
MLVIGGCGQSMERVEDMWLYNMLKQNWEEVVVPSGPTAVALQLRSEHSGLSYQNNVVIFGGRSSAMKELNDVMIFHTTQKSWVLASENCLRPTADKSFVLKEASSPGKSPTSKVADGSFSPEASAVRLEKQSRASGIKEGGSPTSPRRSKRKNGPPKMISVAELESAFEGLGLLTPTTSTILNSTVMKAGERCLEPYLQVVRKRKRTSLLYTASRPTDTDDSYCLRGRIPCARSGHSAELFQHYMIIFGGDRSQFALNDIYVYDLARCV